MDKLKKMTAFTLAEVLITLGIIGVIAALTIPALIQNYRNQVVESRLKKFYTVFNQAILRSVADNGETINWDWQSGKDAWDSNLEKYILPYMNIVEAKSLPEYPTYNKFYFLPDGSSFTTGNDIIYFPSNPTKCRLNTSNGVCRFYFQFYPIEMNSDYARHSEHKGLDAYKFGWDGTENGLYESSTFSYGCNTNQKGYFCTAIIQLNGWKIPKNYPRKVKFTN